MNAQGIYDLAAQVAREASRPVSVGLGRTNGRPCLHVVDKGAPDTRLASRTIYTVEDWEAHPLNRRNAPRTPRPAEPPLVVRSV